MQDGRRLHYETWKRYNISANMLTNKILRFWEIQDCRISHLKIEKNHDISKSVWLISMKFGLLITMAFWTLWARKKIKFKNASSFQFSAVQLVRRERALKPAESYSPMRRATTNKRLEKFTKPLSLHKWWNEMFRGQPTGHINGAAT